MRNNIPIVFALVFLVVSSTVAFFPSQQAHTQVSTETVTFSVLEDSSIIPRRANINYGALAGITVSDSGVNHWNTLLEFDQNVIESTLLDSTVVDATLRLYVTDASLSTTETNDLNVHRLLESWEEGSATGPGGTGSGVTWNCAIDTDVSNNVADCLTQWNGGNVATITDTLLVEESMENTWIELDVTNDVQQFLDGTNENYGWLLSLGDITNQGWPGNVLSFSSKEAGSNPPELKIDFESSPEFLVNEHNLILSELSTMSNISDKSVSSDYLNHAINSLKTDTETLVTDPTAKQSLVAILDSALQSTSDAGIDVLALDETSASQHLDDARNDLNDYVTEVSSLSGTTIPTSIADLLISQANQIHTDSQKTGEEAVEIIVQAPLTITSQIIAKVKADTTTLRDIVNDLDSLGFSVTIEVEKNSPAVTTISFINPSTSEQFDIIISDSTLAMFMTTAFFEEALHYGSITLDNVEYATLMSITPIIANNMINSNDDDASIGFSLTAMCPSYFSVAECESTFEDPGGIGAHFAIGAGASQALQKLATTGVAIVSQCVRNIDDCMNIIDTAIENFLVPQGNTALDNLYPTLYVIKNVINDDGGTLQPSNFTITVSGSNPTIPIFPGENGTGTKVRMTTGNYGVTEDSVLGYSPTLVGCQGLMTPALTLTCTITNDDDPSELHTSILLTSTRSGGDIIITKTFLKCYRIEVGTPEIGKVINTVGFQSAFQPSGPSTAYRIAVYEGDGANAVFKAATSIVGPDPQNALFHNSTLQNDYIVGTTDKNKIWSCIMKDADDPNQLQLRATFPHEQIDRRQLSTWPNFPSSLINTFENFNGDNVPYIQLKGLE